MNDFTHAYVGFRKDGAAIMVFVDDASKDCAKAVADVIRKGGCVERVTIEQACEYAATMYKKPAAT
jgi:hypothetical protein